MIDFMSQYEIGGKCKCFNCFVLLVSFEIKGIMDTIKHISHNGFQVPIARPPILLFGTCKLCPQGKSTM